MGKSKHILHAAKNATIVATSCQLVCCSQADKLAACRYDRGLSPGRVQYMFAAFIQMSSELAFILHPIRLLPTPSKRRGRAEAEVCSDEYFARGLE